MQGRHEALPSPLNARGLGGRVPARRLGWPAVAGVALVAVLVAVLWALLSNVGRATLGGRATQGGATVPLISGAPPAVQPDAHPAADPAAPAAANPAFALPAAATVASTGPGTSAAPSAGATDLAYRVAGRYWGDILADSQRVSRRGVKLTVTRLDALHVRIDSPDEPRLRMPRLRISLVGQSVLAERPDTAFVVDLSTQPVRLSYAPRHVPSFSGVRQAD